MGELPSVSYTHLRVGVKALRQLGDSNDFVRGQHARADLDPENRYIVQFPEDNAIWSINSGYGGNVLLLSLIHILFGTGFFLNNIFVLALVYAATALPFTIYLLSGYFATLPKMCIRDSGCPCRRP